MSDDSVIVIEPEQNGQNQVHFDETPSFKANRDQFLAERGMDRTKGLVVVSVLMSEFKMKVEEAEVLTSTMMMEEKLEAIDFMSSVLERLRCSVSYGKDDGTVIGCDQESNVEVPNDVPFCRNDNVKSSCESTKPIHEIFKNDGSVSISPSETEPTNDQKEDISDYGAVNYNLFPADIKKENIEVKSEFPGILSQDYIDDNDCNSDNMNGYLRGVKGDLTNLFWHHAPLTKIGYNSVIYNAISSSSQRSLNRSATCVRKCRKSETPEMEQRRREKQALRMRVRRALESNEARQRRLQLNAARNRLKRANETPEFRQRRRAMQAQRMRERRAREVSDAPEINQIRREVRARRMREHRARLSIEMPELVKIRREREARRMRERRAREMIEAPDLIQLRRAIQARQMRERRANETPEEREQRRERDAARKRMKRATQKEGTWFSVENVPPEMKQGDQLIVSHPSSSSLFNISQMNVHLC